MLLLHLLLGILVGAAVPSVVAVLYYKSNERAVKSLFGALGEIRKLSEELAAARVEIGAVEFSWMETVAALSEEKELTDVLADYCLELEDEVEDLADHVEALKGRLDEIADIAIDDEDVFECDCCPDCCYCLDDEDEVDGEPAYAVFDGEGVNLGPCEVVPCPDGIPGCEVLHLKPKQS